MTVTVTIQEFLRVKQGMFNIGYTFLILLYLSSISSNTHMAKSINKLSGFQLSKTLLIGMSFVLGCLATVGLYDQWPTNIRNWQVQRAGQI